MNKLSSKWYGPYSIIPVENASLEWVATRKEALRPGIYLWTVKVGDEYRVNYIGMSTNSITARSMEHVSNSFGAYPVEQPEYFRQGRKKDYLFSHARDKDWHARRDEVLPSIIENLQEIRLFFAPFNVDCLASHGKDELERIESALITQVREYEAEDSSREFLSNYRLSRLVREGDTSLHVAISKSPGQALCGIEESFELKKVARG